MSDRALKIGIVSAAIVGVIGLLLLIILLPISFSYLDFYEVNSLLFSSILYDKMISTCYHFSFWKFGFVRRRTTGNVDTKRVYAGGRHLIGPDFEFKEFYAAAQYVSYSHIPIFTTDNLQVRIESPWFQWHSWILIYSLTFSRST